MRADGTFTAASVLAGLVVYDEARYVAHAHRLLMAAGVLLVVCGCALVGSRRAVRGHCVVHSTLRFTSDDDERQAASEDARERDEAALLRQHLGEHLLPRSHGNANGARAREHAML